MAGRERGNRGPRVETPGGRGETQRKDPIHQSNRGKGKKKMNVYGIKTRGWRGGRMITELKRMKGERKKGSKDGWGRGAKVRGFF